MSGKSCFLKAVGIIVFLAHVGSFVPAEAAVVGLTDRMFTRMASLQARAPLQSSFMAELSQVAAMLHCASQRYGPRMLTLLERAGVDLGSRVADRA